MKILKDRERKSYLALFLLAVSVIIAYKFISEFHYIWGWIGAFINIISPFIAGFCLAFILSMPRNAIRRLLMRSKIPFLDRHKGGLSILLTYAAFLLIIVVAMWLIIPAIYESIYDFLTNLPHYYKNVQEYIDQFNELGLFTIDMDIANLLGSSMLSTIKVENVLASMNAVFGVSSAVLNIFLAFVSSIYILLEGTAFKNFIARLLKAFVNGEIYKNISEYSRKLSVNFKQYLYCQALDGVIIGGIAAIEMLILGSDYAVLLGVMLGVFNMVPYFGAIIGTVIAVLVVAFTDSIMKAVIVAIVLLVTQQLDGNIIQPRLMSGSFSMSPLLIIISVSVGGSLAGPLGMIVAIPVVAVLKELIEDIIIYREAKKSDKEKDITAGNRELD